VIDFSADVETGSTFTVAYLQLGIYRQDILQTFYSATSMESTRGSSGVFFAPAVLPTLTGGIIPFMCRAFCGTAGSRIS